MTDLYGFYNMGKEREWPEGSGQWRLPPPPRPDKVRALILACAERKLRDDANMAGINVQNKALGAR